VRRRPASLSHQGWILHRRRQTEAQAKIVDRKTSTSFSGTAGWPRSITPRHPRGRTRAEDSRIWATKSHSDFVPRRAEGGGTDRGTWLTDEQVPRGPGVMCGDDVSWRLGRSRNPDIGIGTLTEARWTSFGVCEHSAPDLATINWRASLASYGPTVCLLLIVGPRLRQPSGVDRQVGRVQPAPA
jgi:hypothetical protein